MHYVELLLVIAQPIVIALDPLVQRGVVRNLQGMHYLAVVMHALHNQKLLGEQTSHHVAREYQQHRTA